VVEGIMMKSTSHRPQLDWQRSKDFHVTSQFYIWRTTKNDKQWSLAVWDHGSYVNYVFRHWAIGKVVETICSGKRQKSAGWLERLQVYCEQRIESPMERLVVALDRST
jgi:hypothetical protein